MASTCEICAPKRCPLVVGLNNHFMAQPNIDRALDLPAEVEISGGMGELAMGVPLLLKFGLLQKF